MFSRCATNHPGGVLGRFIFQQLRTSPAVGNLVPDPKSLTRYTYWASAEHVKIYRNLPFIDRPPTIYLFSSTLSVSDQTTLWNGNFRHSGLYFDASFTPPVTGEISP